MTNRDDSEGVVTRNAPALGAPPPAVGGPARRVTIFHESAGAVVIFTGRCVVLRRDADWVLPKGHLESGERPEQAAIREVREETGLSIRIIRALGTTRYEFDGTSSRSHRKLVHWFLAERVGGSLRPGPQFTEALLLDRSEAEKLLTHPSDRDLVTRAFDTIRGPSRGEAQ